MNFDWDDNIMFMPTKIVYFANDQQSPYQELLISTEGFAHSRNKVGTESFLMGFKKINDEYHDCPLDEAEVQLDVLNYKIISDREGHDDHSFRGFRDCSKNNYFIKDLKQAIIEKSFGPSFNDFIYACSKREIVKNVTIITARGHSPKVIYEGLRILQELGLIKHLPLISNIFPVSNPKFYKKLGGTAQNPSEVKTKILIDILDTVQKRALNAPEDRYSFGFSDDDGKTYAVVEEAIKMDVRSGRWSLVEISLYFTGQRKNMKAILNFPEEKVS